MYKEVNYEERIVDGKKSLYGKVDRSKFTESGIDKEEYNRVSTGLKEWVSTTHVTAATEAASKMKADPTIDEVHITLPLGFEKNDGVVNHIISREKDFINPKDKSKVVRPHISTIVKTGLVKPSNKAKKSAREILVEQMKK